MKYLIAAFVLTLMMLNTAQAGGIATPGAAVQAQVEFARQLVTEKVPRRRSVVCRRGLIGNARLPLTFQVFT